MTWQRLLLPLATIAFAWGGVAQTQEKKIAMTAVKYAGLQEEVLKQRGKVVVVDFWAGY